jgi:hypothetical protein
MSSLGTTRTVATVLVNSSSIAGTVFRDFADDGSITAGDTFVGGVSLTLTGTAFDGTSITRTVTTTGRTEPICSRCCRKGRTP